MSDILKHRAAQNGRHIKEDGRTVNIANLLEKIHDKLINEPEPRILATIDYSEFTAGGTVTKFFLKNLNRNAKRRALFLFNSMDISPSQQRITMNDSFLYETSRTAGATATTSQTVGNNNCIQVIDGSAPQLTGNYGELLNAPVDSFSLAISIGTTTPTTGKIQLAIMEVLHI